ncbi:hypothetical protein E2C01_025733 [Portunus trituberculatus]|uniref:Uncharacterized protein n=1 Tax=Portunus trituberculatus TaxID=210409 RepID=A0A5B7EH96_PORTR|nr:hypothetical protein [Portunus trituberculatus]
MESGQGRRGHCLSALKPLCLRGKWKPEATVLKWEKTCKLVAMKTLKEFAGEQQRKDLLEGAAGQHLCWLAALRKATSVDTVTKAAAAGLAPQPHVSRIY